MTTHPLATSVLLKDYGSVVREPAAASDMRAIAVRHLPANEPQNWTPLAARSSTFLLLAWR
jgi:hypothetical protein